MNSVGVSGLITLGIGVWVYLKFQKYSGNNTKQSALAAGVASILIFTVLLFITKKLLG